jgi:hypothetical protein
VIEQVARENRQTLSGPTSVMSGSIFAPQADKRSDRSPRQRAGATNNPFFNEIAKSTPS